MLVDNLEAAVLIRPGKSIPLKVKVLETSARLSPVVDFVTQYDLRAKLGIAFA